MQILCILISILLTLSVTANFSTADDSKNEKKSFQVDIDGGPMR